MKPGLGWMHIKDYRCPDEEKRADAKKATAASRRVDEDAIKHYVPADVGHGAYEAILRDFSGILPAVERKLRRRGIPGVFLDLEPHLKSAGQLAGFSGPDGMGVALRALCRVLDFVGIDYHLRDFSDIQAARGF